MHGDTTLVTKCVLDLSRGKFLTKTETEGMSPPEFWIWYEKAMEQLRAEYQASRKGLGKGTPVQVSPDAGMAMRGT